jgi:hypothetical protein
VKAVAVEPSLDAAEVSRAWSLLVQPGDVAEVRAIEADGTIWGGYFKDAAALLRALPTVADRCKGVYITLNPVDPALMARSPEKFKVSRSLTKDENIIRRRWLPLDFDPVRPAGQSATDSEHAAAREAAEDVYEWLRTEGWPSPIQADSGNGSHLAYAIDLPADDDGLVAEVLDVLSARFSDDKVHLDTNVANASRIWKLYGTTARKGTPTPERPHRMARLVDTPERVLVVPRAKLEALALSARRKAPPTPAAKRTRASVDLADVERRAVPYLETLAAEAPAISGEGGHRALMWAARCMVYGFDLGPDVGFRLLADIYNPACQPPWSDKELRHKAEQADTKPFKLPRGWLRDAERERPAASSRGVRVRSSDLCEAPPVEGDDGLRSYAEIEAKETHWLWAARLPIGELALVVGPPDCGKSCVLFDLAARISSGRELPGDVGTGKRRGVLLAVAEDSPERTVRPRLEVAGADLSHIHEVPDDFNLSQMDRLEKWIVRYDVALVVIDPAFNFLPAGLNKDKEEEVRPVLRQLLQVVERTRCCAVMIIHTKKGSADMPLHKILGSQAWGAVPRAAWGVAKHPNDPDARVFTKLKMNLAPDPGTLCFTIGTADYAIGGKEVTMPLLQWGEVDRETTAEDVFENPGKRGGGADGYSADKTEAAWKFIRDTLGPCGQAGMLSEDLFKAGQRMSIGRDLLYTIKQAHKNEVQAFKPHGSAKWAWRLLGGPFDDVPQVGPSSPN